MLTSTRFDLRPMSHDIMNPLLVAGSRYGFLFIAFTVLTLADEHFSAAEQPSRQEEPLSIEDARVTVTGYDFNRPDPFPGLGEFSWPGNVAQTPDGELLLVHSAGYYHVSFAQPRLIEPATRTRWLAGGWPLDVSAPTGGRSMLVRSQDGGRTWSKPETLIDLPLDDSPYGLSEQVIRRPGRGRT